MGLRLWQLAALLLCKGGREKGYAPETEGSYVIGAGGHLGASQGLPSTLMSTLWVLPRCSRCSSGCCCGPSVCCQVLEAPAAVEEEACRGGESHLAGRLAGGRCCVAGQQQRAGAGKGRKH